jgi:CDP-6-deoxy-D-xylo-4-hexulose-3-dehydrase
MGEGGAVNIVSSGQLRRIVESLRDWGRDCWCPSGKDDTCNKRYDWQLGELPKGYDHKYIYSHFGYNLKPLDPQAAIGRVQLKRLPAFIDARKQNWARLRRGLDGLSDVLSFSLPSHARDYAMESAEFSWDDSGCRTDCSWFGFLLLVKPEAPFSSADLGRHLAEQGVGTRMLFGGNLLRQPAFVQLKQDRPDAIRLAVADLSGADQLMEQAIFLGTYPGLTEEMIDREVEMIWDFVAMRRAAMNDVEPGKSR